MEKRKVKKKSSKFLIIMIIVILFLVSGFFVAKHFIDINNQYQAADLSLKDADVAIKKGTDFRGNDLKDGKIIGKLKIDKHTSWMPIREGDGTKSLAKGIGHLKTSNLPGEGWQSVFSAHRESFFKSLKNTKMGDIVTVQMPYGVYKYKIDKHIIVHNNESGARKAYDTSDMNGERIVLITCYPYESWKYASRRSVFYGTLISADETGIINETKPVGT